MTRQPSAIGYTRVSQEPENKTVEESLESQKRLIQEFADDKGLNLQMVLSDGEASGFTHEERPVMMSLIEEVNGNPPLMKNYDYLILRDLARISRTWYRRPEILGKINEHSNYDHTGVYVVHEMDVLRGPIDLDDEVHASYIQSRTQADDATKRLEIKMAKRGMRENIKQGGIHGRPPKGLGVEDNQYIVTDRSYVKQLFQATQEKNKRGTSYNNLSNKYDVNGRNDVYKLRKSAKEYKPWNEEGGLSRIEKYAQALEGDEELEGLFPYPEVMQNAR